MNTATASWVAPLACLISFVVLVANGRAIGSGDTNAVERTAAALAGQGTFVLPEDAAQDPFTRPTAGGRISIYPPLPALLAMPVFFLFSLVFDLNPAGQQIAGKLSAALVAAGAVALLARSYASRSTSFRALVSALLFGLGTSVYSTAQALWQHPAALFFLVAAICGLERMETLPKALRWRPGLIVALGLSLSAAARPAAIPMNTVLFLFLLHRTGPGAFLRLCAIALVPAGFVSVYNTHFFGAPWLFGPGVQGRFLSAFPESIAGLLASPGRGVLVFTPIALLALWQLVNTARRSNLARGLLCAVTVHILFIATWNEWHGGESFGPRLLTDMLPALFFFMPEALAAWPRAGAGLGVISVAIQLLGGWTYDYRWERLHQRGREFESALWSWPDAPLAFAVREGVLIQGTPSVEGRRVRLQLRRSVPFGTEGSLIEATPSGLRIGGSALVHDVRLERGARMRDGRITLTHPGDALAFRSRSARLRTVRIVGSTPRDSSPQGWAQTVLRLESRGRSTSLSVAGDFDLAIDLSLGGGEDAFVRAESGELRIARVSFGTEEVRP